MSAIIRNSLRIANVTNFINSYSSGVGSLYLGIARPEYWYYSTSQDTPVPNPYNNVISDDQDWEDMMQLKIIPSGNMSYGIYKEMWTNNVKYDAYRHDWNGSRQSVYNGPNTSTYVPYPADLSQAKYYVITSLYNIYICLQQSIINGVVQPSTVDPDFGSNQGTTSVIQCSDGYYWKFIANTGNSQLSQFSTATYHPVSTITTTQTANSPYFNQWTSQTNSATYKGGVYTVNVISGGTGYNAGAAGSAPLSTNATITGDGTGIQGTITYGAGGSILSIQITNPGTGYSYIDIIPTGGTGVVLDVIYTSMKGLGVDPVSDLNAFNCIINQSLISNESGVFTVTNSYRKVCLVSNPYTYNTTTIATATDLDATISLVVSGGSYTPNEVVTDSVTGAKGIVVDSGNGVVRVIRTSNENFSYAGGSTSFQAGSTLQPSSGTISSITEPTVAKYSGKIIYAEYRPAILRATGQTENITVVLSF